MYGQYIARAGGAQGGELVRDLVGRAVERYGLAGFRGVLVLQDVRAALLARRARDLDRAAAEFRVALQRRHLVGPILRDVDVARDGHRHGIEFPAARLDRRPVAGDALADDLRRRKLVEQEIVAALGRAADRRRAAGSRPERRVRLLGGRRLDDDILVAPVLPAMGETPAGGPGFGDDLQPL